MPDPTTNPTPPSEPNPNRLDNLAGAPLPPPTTPLSKGQVLETPEEARLRAEYDKHLHQDQTAGAAVGATGIGCLSLALLPWSIGIVILFAVLLMSLFHGSRAVHVAHASRLSFAQIPRQVRR